MKSIVFAGGCFWCITPPLAALDGVSEVVCGYCGGSKSTANYAQVKSQHTDHRECIKVTYDERAVFFETLFRTFLENVDPFDAEGQFIDHGLSYTLAVFSSDEQQMKCVRQLIAETEARSGRHCAIALLPEMPFYPAEEEHQDYYLKQPEAFANELKISGRASHDGWENKP